VAALAFCLRHDRKFLEHFWKCICQVRDDPWRMPPITAEGILLEPPHWADLRLISEHRGRRCVWVVEVKAGARLKARQRPDRPEVFMQPDYGYGALFAKEERSRGKLEIFRGNARAAPIVLQQRSWTDIMPGLERTAIVEDLFETLGELQINPFYMEKTKKITIRDRLQNVGQAWQVLTAVCEYLEVRPSCQEFEPETFDDGSGHMGIYIKPPSKRTSRATKHLALQKATRKEGWCLAWFGYEYDGRGQVKKVVWFYLKDAQRQHSLHQKLRGQFPALRKENVDGDIGVVVESSPEKSCGDLAWFESVFQRALKS
jgi:hypothetical protein